MELYQLHNAPAEVMANPRMFDVLESLKREGKIGHYGVSIHEPEEGRLCLESGRPEVLQIPFSLFRQEWIDELLPAAREAGVGILAREPLGNGFLARRILPETKFPPGDIRARWPAATVAARAAAADRLAFLVRDGRSRAQAALRFVLAYPEVSSAIPGAKTPEQSEENLRATDAVPLKEAELRESRRLYARAFDL